VTGPMTSFSDDFEG